MGLMVTIFSIASCNKVDEIPDSTNMLKLTIERDAGITFTNEELTIWRDRALNGPYKTKGDRFTESPGSWDAVVVRAEKFMNDEVDEFWNGVLVSTDQVWASYTYNRGHYLLAAAFYGLVKENNKYRQKAKEAILAQIANKNPIFEDYLGITSGWPNAFHFANFTTRLFHAFDYTYDLWTPQEIADYEAWMERALVLYRKIWLDIPAKNFPNRNNDDYSSRSSWALTGEELSHPYYDDKKWTYTDASGARHNYLRLATGRGGYGNGEFNFAGAELTWAIYKNETDRIDDIKRWFREWLMFAVWPDGTTSENVRNGDYGRPSTGTMHYGAISLEIMAYIAELSRRRGDNYFYEYSTSDGYWGTEGGNKNLRLVINTLIDCMRSTVDRFWWLPQEENRLSTLNGTFRYRPEMAIAISNIYYNDDLMGQTYKNQASGCITYFSGMGGRSYKAAINTYD